MIARNYSPADRVVEMRQWQYDELQAEVDRLRDDLGEALVRENNLIGALEEIERIGWREGTRAKSWLIECRIIARKALASVERT